jgi:RNA polymerase primary sigma factor
MALRVEDIKEPLDSAEDSVTFYLRDIGAIPLLTAAEEVELAKRIERGVEANKRLDGPLPLAPEERATALAEARDGDAARRKLVESNLRLVVSVARRYGDRGLPLADLIAEGNFGLMRAAEKFDYHKGYRFSTYATWWIRQAVARGAANQSRVVRLPIHVGEQMAAVAKGSHKLLQELGRQPTSEELARETHLSPDQVMDVVRASQHPVSLDQPYGRESDGTVGELVEDTSAPRPVDYALRQALRTGVQALLGELTEREQRVLTLRYGLEDDRPRTLEEVGRALGVTRERVRQIEHEALSRLRGQGRAEALRDFLS